MQIDKDIMISKNAIDMKIEKYRSICIKNIAKLDALSPLKTFQFIMKLEMVKALKDIT